MTDQSPSQAAGNKGSSQSQSTLAPLVQAWFDRWNLSDVDTPEARELRSLLARAKNFNIFPGKGWAAMSPEDRVVGVLAALKAPKEPAVFSDGGEAVHSPAERDGATAEPKPSQAAALTPEVREDLKVKALKEIERYRLYAKPAARGLPDWARNAFVSAASIVEGLLAALEEAEAQRDHYRANGHQQALRARGAEVALSALQQENERLRNGLTVAGGRLAWAADTHVDTGKAELLTKWSEEVKGWSALQAPQSQGGEGNG